MVRFGDPALDQTPGGLPFTCPPGAGILPPLPFARAGAVMRPIPVRSLLIAGVIALAQAPTVVAEPVESARRERLVVRGLTSLDPDRFAQSLAADDDLLLLTGPLTTRKALLAAVIDKATLALQRQGFAAPQVTATIEQDDAGEQVIVDVVEGPRQMAAGIEITGLPDELAANLRRWLKSQRPPPDAVPQSLSLIHI